MVNDTETGIAEPQHGDENPDVPAFWCTQCKIYIPKYDWDFHKKYHNPDTEISPGDTNIGKSALKEE